MRFGFDLETTSFGIGVTAVKFNGFSLPVGSDATWSFLRQIIIIIIIYALISYPKCGKEERRRHRPASGGGWGVGGKCVVFYPVPVPR